MSNLTQEDFDVAQEVLEYMAASTRTHEPYAVNTIASIENALNENSFQLIDYPE